MTSPNSIRAAAGDHAQTALVLIAAVAPSRHPVHPIARDSAVKMTDALLRNDVDDALRLAHDALNGVIAQSPEGTDVHRFAQHALTDLYRAVAAANDQAEIG